MGIMRKAFFVAIATTMLSTMAQAEVGVRPLNRPDPGDIKAVNPGLDMTPGVDAVRRAMRGGVWAWGGNGHGQLGDGITSDSNIPMQVVRLSGVSAIAAGGFHSLALKDDGTVWAWGQNIHGQLGDGTSSNANAPVQVRNLSGVRAIAAGHWHSLALKDDGTVWAWGYNNKGQLGNGTGINSAVPVQVTGLSAIKEVAGGYSHSLAIAER